MQMEMISSVLGVAATVTAVQGVLLWRATRALSRVTKLEGRIDQFGEAITLLTDTTESAFRAVATEMTRQPAVKPPAAAAAASTRRTRQVARASRRGASVAQIAAAQEMAEGEVRLRLHVAEQKARPAAEKPRRKTRKRSEPRNAALRVG